MKANTLEDIIAVFLNGEEDGIKHDLKVKVVLADEIVRNRQLFYVRHNLYRVIEGFGPQSRVERLARSWRCTCHDCQSGNAPKTRWNDGLPTCKHILAVRMCLALGIEVDFGEPY